MILSGSMHVPGRCRVVIVGGGITGLSAAHRLLESEPSLGRDVVVLEAADRLGGQIQTLREGPYVLEAGADTMVSQKPAGLALCRRLGLEDEIVHPYASGATVHVARRGKLLPVPDGFLLVGPTRLAPLLTSRLFSPAGKLRMIAELFLPSSPPAEGDESLRSFVTRRFGREAFERVAEPLVGGLFTADADRLSMRMTLPRMLEVEQRSGSVWRGLAAARTRSDPRGDPAHPVALRAGMETLIERLSASLSTATVVTAARVSSLAPERPGWRIAMQGGRALRADVVVLACPSFVAAGLLRDAAPAAAARLAVIEHASCAIVNLAYDRSAVGSAPDGFGFFVPRTEGVPVLACSHVSRKFEGRTPTGQVALRVYLGGALHPEVLDRDDDDLVALARAFLGPLLRLRGAPRLARVHRHVRAMPQLTVGDLARVQAIERHVAELDGVLLCGGGLGAIGIPDCIRSGERAAERALEHLTRGHDSVTLPATRRVTPAPAVHAKSEGGRWAASWRAGAMMSSARTPGEESS